MERQRKLVNDQKSGSASVGKNANGQISDKNGGEGSSSKSFWESEKVGCVDKCIELHYMYSNIVSIMVSRMLKLMLWILKHRILLEPELR